MLKDSGLFLVLLSCYIVVILTLKGFEGYAHTSSDWRGVKCDFSTNKPVAKFYGNPNVDWYRVNKTDEFEKRIIKGDTVIVGIDYYALYYVAAPIIPQEVLAYRQKDLLNGKVFTYKVWLDKDRIVFSENTSNSL
jgi:hypothetical protein